MKRRKRYRQRRWPADVLCPVCGRTRTVKLKAKWESVSPSPRRCQPCASGAVLRESIRYRWNPDLNVVDDLVVEFAVSGQQMTTNRLERIEITRILTARGWSANRIAAHLQVTYRSVNRYRNVLASTAGEAAA